MGIRTGSEFIESLRDERAIFVNGERLTDVTTYPPFQGILATLASLYDLNHERREELTFASPTDGAPVALSFLIANTLEQKDFANPEIAGLLDQYLQGTGVSAKHRVQLFKLAWDLVGDQFGSRQAHYEYFYAGDPYVNRARFYHAPVVQQYKDLVMELLEGKK